MERTTMPKSVLVTGSKGQLGLSIEALASQYSEFQFAHVDIEELDLSNSQTMDAFFENNSFDVIINCAAYTAVDKAESEPEIADAINHLAVKYLAKLAKQKDMVLIHVSTDYVFNGQNFKPYGENDPTDPQSVYGDTKLKGELAYISENPKGIIIRSSWVYSEYGNNFVKTMLRLGAERDALNVIYDQVGSPTYAGDLAKAILDILQSAELDKLNREDKLFNYSNEGVCSWYDFAKVIFEISATQCEVSPIETKDYATPAQRPHYSLMNKSKIKSRFGLEIMYWKNSLLVCLDKLREKNEFN